MFTDQVEIQVRSGKGGDGMVHFRREKFIPRGGPDGGDGGKGGDVIFEVRPTLNALSAFRPNQKFKAEDGVNGGASQMTGRGGKDLIIPIPPGTILFDAETNEIIGDLTQPKQQFVVCRGGRGGRGNQHFATSRNQAPRIAEKGAPNEEKRIRLELKLIADLGLIGVPNAGKSTLLSVLTNARPKIAAYPFTTLEPNLGVAEIDVNASVVLADIPGLIEGASRGAGLGHDFLRHIQRTRVLIHLLDGLSDDPFADYSQINSELALFDPNLAKKPQIVALNKIDQPDVQEKLPALQKQFKKLKVELFTISALARTNTRELLVKAYQVLQETPEFKLFEAPLPVYKTKEDPRDFNVMREGAQDWRVAGVAIERAAAMTQWEHDGSVRRFQRIMETLGVDEALRSAGVQEGDTVAIGDFELEWQE
ncbi:MAG: GTPase ObgE [Anaerolineaceae bacterium]|nr:GTPase ObgE [Anaerolineaceae bacterium]OQY89814.1 MAG: GTPase ObgE [Anaerolineae bacterium UTCFX1]